MLDLSQYSCTDTGNAERLVAYAKGRIRYCYERKRWLLWDGARWAWCLQGEIDQLSKEVLRETYAAAYSLDDDARKALLKHVFASEAAGRREAMVRLAQSEFGIAVRAVELDADPWLLNTATGTLDLRTGRLRPAAASDLITKLCPARYDADAASALWDTFLRDVTGGDASLAAYLKRLAGYCLTGSTREKAFFFLYGPPDGAKSTFVRVLSTLLGDYAEAPAFSTWLVQTSTGGNRGDLVKLAGARLAVSVETRKTARFDEEILKRITGGDLVTAAAKYESEVTFQPACKIVLAANDAPRAREEDAGFWNRCKRVPFDCPIPKEKQDTTMTARLTTPEGLSAILAWAVEGCLDWQAEGLGTCAAVERSTKEYRREADMHAGWFEEECRFVGGSRHKRSTARRAYETWCRENGVRTPLGPKEFGARMEKLGFRVVAIDGERYYKGLEIEGSSESIRKEPN